MTNRGAHSLFGTVLVLYGISLIADFGDQSRYLRTIDLSADPTGIGAIFAILGAWLVMKDGRNR